jgi:hypothetical protein
MLIRAHGINLFERGIQGVSIDEKQDAKSTIKGSLTADPDTVTFK